MINLSEEDLLAVVRSNALLHEINNDTNRLHQIEMVGAKAPQATIDNPSAIGVAVTWRCRLCERVMRVAFLNNKSEVLHDDLKSNCSKA